LSEGRISDGLFLIRWLPAEQRGPYLNRARSSLYSHFVANIEAKRFGLALRDFFFVHGQAPAEWGVRDRFRVAFLRILPPYETRVDWSEVFEEGSPYAAQFAFLKEAGATLTGRPSAQAAAAPAWKITAQLEAPLNVLRELSAVKVQLPSPNPDFRSVQEALAIERRRLKRAEKDRDKAAEMLEVAKAQGREPSSTNYKARAARLDKSLEKVVDIEGRTRGLEETQKGVKTSFLFELEGESESVLSTARAIVETVDPAGGKQRLSVALHRRERFVHMKPLSALDWQGIDGRSADDSLERERYIRAFVDQLISTALTAVEKQDIDRLLALLNANGDRRATDADLSELFELVAMYAPRLDGAARGLREIDALRERMGSLSELHAARFHIVEDQSLDRSPPLAVVAETGIERERLQNRIVEIEHRYALYLDVTEKLQAFFSNFGGRRLEDFLQMAMAVRGSGR